MVGLCPPGSPILLQLRELCRGSVTLLQVARPFQSSDLYRGYSSPVALNLCLPAFGTSGNWLRCGGAELLEQAVGRVWGCGCGKNHE